MIPDLRAIAYGDGIHLIFGPPPEPTPELTIDYCGPFIYEDGQLKRVLFDGGYITFDANSNNAPEYHFHVTDHLGNIRAVVNQNDSIEEINHYYPYGTLFGESTGLANSVQPYKYSGKELDRMHGLDMFDHGARWSDPLLGRWHKVDPLAEEYTWMSPYILCGNNPINIIDPDGQDGVLVVDEEEKRIIVRADYFVVTTDKVSRFSDAGIPGYSTKEIVTMAENINSYLNGLNLSVTEGEYKDYSVDFELSFFAGGTPNETQKKAKNDFLEGYPIGNTFDHNDESYPRFRERETNTSMLFPVSGGFTAKNKYILMNTNYDTKRNRIHEIFHTLGLHDHTGGIMKYPPQKPNKQNINQLIYNGFLPHIKRK